jgi:hypothetical protein
MPSIVLHSIGFLTCHVPQQLEAERHRADSKKLKQRVHSK